MKDIRGSLMLLVLTVVVCCIAYPVVLYAIGQTVFPSTAGGSLVTEKGSDGKDIAKGSRLIAQPFSSDEYFWPRPSAAGYNGTASSGSNLGANNPKLRDRVSQQIGPMVVYKAGSKSAGPDKANPRSPQEDIEAWFASAPDRAAKWASDVTLGPVAWAKIDYSAKTDSAPEKYGLQGEYILAWTKNHPAIIADWKKANPDKKDDPKPEELIGGFFASFAAAHPAKWLAVRVPKEGDKKIEPATLEQMNKDDELKSNLAVVHAYFFDLWISDPANKDKVADLEPVIADMVMTSGSGLDPHITLRNALSVYQLDRVAKKRTPASGDWMKTRKEIDDLVKKHSFTPLSGLLGEPLVNVLELNLELETKWPVPASAKP